MEDFLSCMSSKKVGYGDFLVVQWLGLCASTAGGPGSIPGWETGILQPCKTCSLPTLPPQKSKICLLMREGIDHMLPDT